MSRRWPNRARHRLAALSMALGLSIPLLAPVAAQGERGAGTESADDLPGAHLLAPADPLDLGRPFELTLVVTHSVESLALPPRLPREWGPLEVESQTPPESRSATEGRVTRQRITARAWATGTLATPSLTVTLLGPAGEPRPLAVAPARLDVASSLAAGERLPRDLRAQAEIPPPPRWPLFLLAFGLASASLYAATPRLLRELRRRLSPLPARVDYGPAAQLALRVLDGLDAEGLVAEGRLRRHYERASDCLRAYLEAVLQLPALDRTTTETLAALGRAGLPEALRAPLERLLREADMVKFARLEPGAKQAASYNARLRQAIEAVESDRRARRALAAVRSGRQVPEVKA